MKFLCNLTGHEQKSSLNQMRYHLINEISFLHFNCGKNVIFYETCAKI